jgi:hypothetical protein
LTQVFRPDFGSDMDCRVGASATICPSIVAVLPILILLALFGALVIVAQGSAVAPFIYTLF